MWLNICLRVRTWKGGRRRGVTFFVFFPQMQARKGKQMNDNIILKKSALLHECRPSSCRSFLHCIRVHRTIFGEWMNCETREGDPFRLFFAALLRHFIVIPLTTNNWKPGKVMVCYLLALVSRKEREDSNFPQMIISIFHI